MEPYCWLGATYGQDLQRNLQMIRQCSRDLLLIISSMTHSCIS
jgi:hypothetical protein